MICADGLAVGARSVPEDRDNPAPPPKSSEPATTPANRTSAESNLIVPVGGARWRAPASCAYSFVLWASSRVLNGYALVFPWVDYHVSLTIQTDAVISATPGAGDCPDCGAASAGSESGCKPMGL